MVAIDQAVARGCEPSIAVDLEPVLARAGRAVVRVAAWSRAAGERAVSRDLDAACDQRFLVRIGDAMRACEDELDALASVVREVGDYLDVARCRFVAVGGGSGHPRRALDHIAMCAQLGGLQLPALDPETTAAWSRGEIVIVDDAHPETQAVLVSPGLRAAPPRAVLLAPVTRDGRCVACLVVTSTTPRGWQDREMNLVRLVAEHAWLWSEHRRHATEIQVAEAALARTTRECQVLRQEVDHRVKNNLQVIVSLMNLQLRRLERGVARDALEECRMRIFALALIQERCYQARYLCGVHFAEYLRCLAGDSSQLMGMAPGTVTLDLVIDDVLLGVEQAIPCALAINELLTEALRRGVDDQSGVTIHVQLDALADGMLRLAVRDHAADRRPRAGSLQLVHTLAEQLDARIVTADDRLAFELVFSNRASSAD